MKCVHFSKIFLLILFSLPAYGDMALEAFFCRVGSGLENALNRVATEPRLPADLPALTSVQRTDLNQLMEQHQHYGSDVIGIDLLPRLEAQRLAHGDSSIAQTVIPRREVQNFIDWVRVESERFPDTGFHEDSSMGWIMGEGLTDIFNEMRSRVQAKVRELNGRNTLSYEEYLELGDLFTILSELNSMRHFSGPEHFVDSIPFGGHRFLIGVAIKNIPSNTPMDQYVNRAVDLMIQRRQSARDTYYRTIAPNGYRVWAFGDENYMPHESDFI